ncbi:MAG TPA: hypothetical protein VGM66_11280 [Candidatus Udaeobacter sp.]|jgi:adenosylmethionine-8-amino-7-oxononanoate aminotransferase
MDEWNIAPDITILVKGFTGCKVPLAITLISEKLFAVFKGFAQLTKAVEALRASTSEVWRSSNASARKDAEEVTA